MKFFISVALTISLAAGRSHGHHHVQADVIAEEQKNLTAALASKVPELNFGDFWQATACRAINDCKTCRAAKCDFCEIPNALFWSMILKGLESFPSIAQFITAEQKKSGKLCGVAVEACNLLTQFNILGLQDYLVKVNNCPAPAASFPLLPVTTASTLLASLMVV